jgi:hypothetical protein
MLNDPIAQKIVRENNLSGNDIESIAGSIASISISATKTQNRNGINLN